MKKGHQIMNKAMISGSYRMSDDFRKGPNQEDVFEVVDAWLNRRGYNSHSAESIPEKIQSLHSKYPEYSIRSIIPMNDGQDGDARHWLIHFRKDNSSLQSDVAELNDKVHYLKNIFLIRNLLKIV